MRLMRAVRGLALLAALVGLAGLAACGGGGGSVSKGSAGGKSAPVTITFWQFWDSGVIRPILDKFEAENPDIKGVMEQQTWENGREKILASVAAGTAPDLGCHEYQPPAAGELVLTEVMANPADEATGEYLELMNPSAGPVDRRSQ